MDIYSLNEIGKGVLALASIGLSAYFGSYWALKKKRKEKYGIRKESPTSK